MNTFYLDENSFFYEGLAELSGYFGFAISKSGIKLNIAMGEKLCVHFYGERIDITISKQSELFRAIGLIITAKGKKDIVQRNNFENVGYFLDLSRNGVHTVNTLKTVIRQMAILGYNQLYLYTEDTYEVIGEKFFGYLRGKLTEHEIRKVVKYAEMFFIEVIPCIQVLGHLSRLFRWEAYYDVCDGYDVLLPGEQKTYALIDNMFKSLRAFYDTDKVHIAMDECASVGLGAYADIHGCPKDRLELFVRHLGKVNELAVKNGFKTVMMWSDIFFNIEGNKQSDVNGRVDDSIRRLVPENVTLVCWHYFKENWLGSLLERHLQFNRQVSFAGTIWKFQTFAPANARSIEYLGYQIENCLNYGIKNFILTTWGDDGCESSVFAGLPTFYHAAQAFYGEHIDKRAFKKLFNADYDSFMCLDLPDTNNSYADIISRASKYMLYDDYFMSKQYGSYRECDQALFMDYYEKIKTAKRNAGEWKYIFDPLMTLCLIMDKKYALYIKTRRAYMAGDRQELEKLVENNYKPLLKLYKKMHKELRKQWFAEFKTQGFEVHDQRFGGLIMRTRDCILRLENYINEKTDCIEELCEQPVNIYLNDEKFGEPHRWAEFNALWSSYKL